MLQRCFEAQWAGLEPVEQQSLVDYGKPSYAPTSSHERTTPLWYILGKGPSLWMISVKDA